MRLEPANTHHRPETSRDVVGSPRQNDESNARLIVAAPMLLKELKKILERISKGSGTGKWTADEHSDLEDLISKAEGRGA